MTFIPDIRKTHLKYFGGGPWICFASTKYVTHKMTFLIKEGTQIWGELVQKARHGLKGRIWSRNEHNWEALASLWSKEDDNHILSCPWASGNKISPLKDSQYTAKLQSLSDLSVILWEHNDASDFRKIIKNALKKVFSKPLSCKTWENQVLSLAFSFWHYCWNDTLSGSIRKT